MAKLHVRQYINSVAFWMIFAVKLVFVMASLIIDSIVGFFYRFTVGDIVDGIRYLKHRKYLGPSSTWANSELRDTLDVESIERKLGWLTLGKGVAATTLLIATVNLAILVQSTQLEERRGAYLVLVGLFLVAMLSGLFWFDLKLTRKSVERQAARYSKVLERPNYSWQPALF